MNFNVDAKLEVANALNGIISKLKNVYNITPIDEEYVVPSSNSGGGQGKVKTLVLWDNYLYQTCGYSEAGTWMQLSFPKGYIYPNAYSMRGTYEANFGRYFPTSWIVYGIYEGDIDDANKYIKLGENKINDSTYCNSVYSNGGCRDKRVGTFKLKKPIPTKGYKYMRWVIKTHDYGNCFASSGLDVYGVLSNSSILFRKMATCRCSRNGSSLVSVILYVLLL